MLPTPEELRARVPADADLDWIAQDLRGTVVRIADLIPDPRNARKHSQRNMDSIKASLTQFGQRAPLAVNSRTLIVEAGNGRLQAMRELGLEYVAVTFHDDDAVTATSYAIADNRTAELAEWDDGVLGELLTSIQEEGVNLDGLGFSEEDLAGLFEEHSDAEAADTKAEADGSTKYTLKCLSPVYQITGECPTLEELVDTGKQQFLQEQIKTVDIPTDVREFLLLATYRHTKFRYDKIAEYYAHAPKQIQELMESSALVIIDYDSAIANGYVQMSAQLEELRKQENEDA